VSHLSTNRLLVSRHVVFDESSFPFVSSSTPPHDLDSVFSSSPVVRPIAPPYPSSIAGTSKPNVAPHAAPAPQLTPLAAPAPTPRAASTSRFTEPPGVPATTSSPAPKPSRVESAIYHPVVVARDPRSTHPMVTRHAAGVTKLVDRLQLSATAAPPTLSSEPTSDRSALTDPHWHHCPTAHGTWFLDLLGPMSSPTSGSSSISSRWMALLISKRLVGSSGASLNALGWTTTRPSAPSSSSPLSRLC
jgi:hypothetical protein